jgi:hypothetical protein
VELSLLRLLHGGGPAGPGPEAGDGGAAVVALSARVARLERRLAGHTPLAPAAEPAPPPPTVEAVPPPVAVEAATPSPTVEAVPPLVAVETAAPSPPAEAAAPSPPAGAAAPSPPAEAPPEASPAAEVAPPEPALAGPSEPAPPLAPTELAAGRPADLDAWQALWTTIVDAVNRRDPMLAGVLRSCRPLEATPGRLVVGAPYGFHLERLQERQKARLLDEVIAEVAGGPCAVEAVFSGSDPPRPPAPPATAGAPDATAAVLATFPGSRITASRLRDAATDGPA